VEIGKDIEPQKRCLIDNEQRLQFFGPDQIGNLRFDQPGDPSYIEGKFTSAITGIDSFEHAAAITGLAPPPMQLFEIFNSVEEQSFVNHLLKFFLFLSLFKNDAKRHTKDNIT
jgi:hypothetical protein